MDAKTEILSRIRNAQQLSHVPEDVTITREYDQTHDLGAEEIKEVLIEL